MANSTELFDKVWVVSLPSSIERRRHIAVELPTAGFPSFSFFEATPADDISVREAFDRGEVAQFPPCFRCGTIDCGKPDCNNFLIPAQVATYLTYRRLWQTIAEGSAERVLVVEDDVLFHDHAARVLQWVAAEVFAGRLPFHETGRACLLRLGWALCAEHRNTGAPCRSIEAVRMANPCHALTRGYAKALLQRDKGICHTVDVFQHQLAPRKGEAFTILPPIASELSWSTGVFASTIHPKTLHVDYLRGRAREDDALAYSQRVAKHIKKKHFRPLLVSGHPRCGTGYASSLCRQLGVDVGHEKVGAGGISSWMFAVDAEWNPYALDEVARTRRAFAWKHLVVPVRNLRDAAPSVVRDSQYAPPSYQFRREHIRRHLSLDLDGLPSPLERAVWSITSWARILLSQEPDLWFRIEDSSELLRAFLIEVGLCGRENARRELDTSPVNADKPYRGVRYAKPDVTLDDWLALDKGTRLEVEWYCAYFGYPLPWRRIEGEEVQRNAG